MKNNTYRRMNKADYCYYINTEYRHSCYGVNNSTVRKVKKLCRKQGRKAINNFILKEVY